MEQQQRPTMWNGLFLRLILLCLTVISLLSLTWRYVVEPALYAHVELLLGDHLNEKIIELEKASTAFRQLEERLALLERTVDDLSQKIFIPDQTQTKKDSTQRYLGDKDKWKWRKLMKSKKKITPKMKIDSLQKIEAEIQGDLEAILYSELDDHDRRISPLERCLDSITFRSSSQDNIVLETDTLLVRPPAPGIGRPLLAPITAYHWKGASYFPEDKFERPIYKNPNRDSIDFWNYLVDELLLSRTHIVMLHGRGCYDKIGDGETPDEGPGNLCPRLLRHFVDAVNRTGAQDVIKVGMFDDTAFKRGLAGVERLDLSVPKNWDYFWSYNIKIWFDTIPKALWYLWNGKPVIAAWTLRVTFFENQQGNASRMLKWIKKKFKLRYGLTPVFVLQESWFTEDSTITKKHALGMHGWFKPVSDEINSVHSFRTYNNKVWGVTTPSFRDYGTVAGCGTACREVTRRNGTTLINAMDKALNEGTSFMLLEGWTNMAESAGFYRSNHWEYPTQYINIVREYADPEPETLRFEAEGADAFYDTTPENLGRAYSERALDVGPLPDTPTGSPGWYVGYTEEGEWLEYQNVKLGCGHYRFTARVATRFAGKKLRLDLGDLPTVDLPFTGGLDEYELVHLGQLQLLGGSYNLRLVFESTGGMNVDWFFVKRSADCYCQVARAI